ncbi:Crp/Fnr family transcriptional regulator [Desulfobacula sp.]|uniref:Crp/Fnr family transcriptional regulator n=1 Tax=Desulfobacula sp. TaxID=2593537 RepID=UPI0025B9C1EC|nr:cyclic nucleotide-binding domain-containing protein [Desulfobacula sp.]MBC2703738.1 cyclic nucleotide-binding domain-containing protein [Desulfobacula sp.]
MSNIKEILNKSSIFSSLGEDDIQRLESLFEKREIHPGDIITNAKDVAQFFFLLNNGTVLLAMEEGRSVVLNTPGDFIGLELLSAGGIYKTTMTVLGNGSVFAVPRQDFLAVIQEDSEAAATIMVSWQEYLDKTASFAKNIEDINLLEHF